MCDSTHHHVVKVLAVVLPALTEAEEESEEDGEEADNTADSATDNGANVGCEASVFPILRTVRHLSWRHILEDPLPCGVAVAVLLPLTVTVMVVNWPSLMLVMSEIVGLGATDSEVDVGVSEGWTLAGTSDGVGEGSEGLDVEGSEGGGLDVGSVSDLVELEVGPAVDEGGSGEVVEGSGVGEAVDEGKLTEEEPEVEIITEERVSVSDMMKKRERGMNESESVVVVVDEK